MAAYFARTPLAMEIAAFDAQKFNQAVSDGHYDCAPSGGRGSTRVFDVDDILALVIFRRQLEAGLPTKAAARIACDLRNFLRDNPGAETALYAVPSIGSPTFWKVDERDKAQDYYKSDFWEFREFQLKNTRARIEYELEQAARILG